MATEWMDSMLNPQISKEAAQVPQGEDKATHEANKLQANAWISDLANVDADAVEKEYQEKLAAEAKLLGKTADRLHCPKCGIPTIEDTGVEDLAEEEKMCDSCYRKEGSKKIAAYEQGDTVEETLKKDYKRDVEILSDYALAEIVAGIRGHQEQNSAEMFHDHKEDAKKEIASNRKKVEEEVLKATGMSAQVDWKKAFERFSKEAKPEEPKEKDLFPKVEEKDVKFDSPTDNKFKLPTKEEMVPAGNGREADERTEVTKQAVPVIKEASLETEAVGYQPKTGEPCSCRPGMERDNCPSCEGTGQKVDFKKIREQNIIPAEKKADESVQSIKREQLYDQASEEHCPVCGAVGENLGSLGQRDHLRCRDCGIMFSHEKEGSCTACASLHEIKAQASKSETIKKIAEIQSPWTVEKLADGTEAIVRREIVSAEEKDLKKESEEDNKDLQK